MNKKFILILLVIVLFAGFFFFKYKNNTEHVVVTPAPEISPSSFDQVLAETTILAFKNKDAKKLSELADPLQGVRFSPSAYVSKEDVVLTSEEMRNFFLDKKVYLWGITDGKGDPINLTPSEYHKTYIYNVDYANAPDISYDKPIGGGNTINNAQDFYPGATIVEYHFPGFNPEYGGMDWTSLRLVFQKDGNTWYLVGVIKDNWTI